MNEHLDKSADEHADQILADQASLSLSLDSAVDAAGPLPIQDAALASSFKFTTAKRQPAAAKKTVVAKKV